MFEFEVNIPLQPEITVAVYDYDTISAVSMHACYSVVDISVVRLNHEEDQPVCDAICCCGCQGRPYW